MDADHHLAGVASAIADPARARMLCALMDGRSRTATELAAVAGISASTASGHLQKLEAARFIECTPAGKHRYFRLAGTEAASAIESLLRVSGRKVPAFRTRTPNPLRFARTCYDHAAGEVAVRLHDWMLGAGWIELLGASEYAVGVAGQVGFGSWGVDLEGAGASRRRFAYPCLDWSERRFHLGGSLGAAVLDALEGKGWLIRELDSRALALTPGGRRGLARLGVKI